MGLQLLLTGRALLGRAAGLLAEAEGMEGMEGMGEERALLERCGALLGRRSPFTWAAFAEKHLNGWVVTTSPWSGLRIGK